MSNVGGSRPGSGSPSGSSLKVSPPSRNKYQCPVCGTEQRTDKLHLHLQRLCQFDSDGKPIDSSHEQYKTLSKEAKSHTDYCAIKAINKDELAKCWKRLSPSDHGLNPFERMQKRQPSEQLRQAMSFADPSENSSSHDPNNENIVPPTMDSSSIPDMNRPDSPVPPVTDAPLPPIIEPPDEHHVTAAAAAAPSNGDECIASGSGADNTTTIENFCSRFMEALKEATDNLSEKIDCDNIADRRLKHLKSARALMKLYCVPCFKYASSPLLPSHLKAGMRGNHGFFNKPNDPRYKTNKERKKRMLDHTRSDIHAWCVNREKDSSAQLEAENKVNDRCAEIIVTSALNSILELDGSEKFTRLNNLLEMLVPSDYPTKNDGRQVYFPIREIVFEKLTEIVRKNFKSVKSACFTLDKVTVRRTPFTVIMTYFFHKGKIHVLLNSVHKMKREEYDGRGSAEMVGKVIMNSLGRRLGTRLIQPLSTPLTSDISYVFIYHFSTGPLF